MFTSHLCFLAAVAISTFTTASPTHAQSHENEKRSVVHGPAAVVTSAAGLNWYSSSLTAGTTGVSPSNKYTCFAGPASNFPPMSQWISYTKMFDNAVYFAFAQKSINDTSEQINYMNQSIIAVSKAARVDARFILATILVESTGNVDVICTTSPGGQHNCGLMQAYDSSPYDPQKPAKSIRQMIVQGVQGTSKGPGQVQLFNDAANTRKQSGGNLYAVAREYNSGSVNATNLSSTNGQTPSDYVSNVANYLLGWFGSGTGSSVCNFNNVINPNPAPSNAGTTPPGPVQAGVAPNCSKWVMYQDGVYCAQMASNAGITTTEFYAWNPAVNVNGGTCNGIWAGYAYCVGVVS